MSAKRSTGGRESGRTSSGSSGILSCLLGVVFSGVSSSSIARSRFSTCMTQACCGAGVAALCRGLRRDETLRHLYLDSNGVTAEGAARGTPPFRKRLSLSSNRIGTLGVRGADGVGGSASHSDAA